LRNYRQRATGQEDWYDLGSGVQFALLIFLGLREHHHVLDIACGPLRVGRLLIPYLLPGRYCGLDPCEWAVYEALRRELGKDILCSKYPAFDHNDCFELGGFKRKFDFLLAQGILQYMGKPQMEKLFSEAAKVMHLDSVFLATYLEGDESYAEDEFTYPEVQHHTMGYLAGLAEEQGLVLRSVHWPYRVFQWIALVFPENKREFGFLFEDYSRLCMDVKISTFLVRSYYSRTNVDF